MIDWSSEYTDPGYYWIRHPDYGKIIVEVRVRVYCTNYGFSGSDLVVYLDGEEWKDDEIQEIEWWGPIPEPE